MTMTSRGSGGDGDSVVAQVADAGLAQTALPVAQLGSQAAQRPRRQVLVQVGDQPDGVRQAGAGIERAAALEVDQQEGQLVRRVLAGQRRHQGAQQFALAGAGGPDDQPVRTVGEQVDGERAVLGHAEGCAQTWGSPAPPAGNGYRIQPRDRSTESLPVGGRDGQQVHQPRPVGEDRRRCGQLRIGPPRQRTGGAGADHRGGPGCRKAHDALTGRGVSDRGHTVLGDFDDDLAHGRQPAYPGGHHHGPDPGQPTQQRRHRAGEQIVAVNDHDGVAGSPARLVPRGGSGAAGTGADGHATGHRGAAGHVRATGPAGGDAGEQSDGRLGVRGHLRRAVLAGQVRHPLGPVPLRQQPALHQQGEADVGRTVPGQKVEHDRGRHGARHRGRPDDAEARPLAQRGVHRNIHQGAPLDQRPFELGHRS